MGGGGGALCDVCVCGVTVFRLCVFFLRCVCVCE